LNPETRKRILNTVSRVFSEVGKALGSESVDYEEGIRVIQNHGGRTVLELIYEILERTAPEISREQRLAPEMLPAFLDAMDTREKAEAVLSGFPEPDSQKLETILTEVSLFLPSVRRFLLPFAKKLRPPPGGAPRKIPESEEPNVRAEVAQLFNDGYELRDAKAIVARRRKVSLSTIQRVCRKRTIQIKSAESDRKRLK